MPAEHCDECGFDGDRWTSEAAVAAIAALPDRWSDATRGLSPSEACRRPIASTWSVSEYADHVREVLFAMRFVLDSAVASPGVDLGLAPEPAFDPEPRALVLTDALDGLRREATALADRLQTLTVDEWTHEASIGDDEVDAHWICRHAVHDATHHLMDIGRVRSALSAT